MEFNIYCDESCHLQNDDRNFMVLGCVWCKETLVKEVHSRIADIKGRNKIARHGEMKWTKISKGNEIAYLDLINYFFDNDELFFRAIVIDKACLNHQRFGQTHDEWYYKMLFELIHRVLRTDNEYKIFLDYKDSQSGYRSRKLHEVLCNSKYDFQRQSIKNVQCLPSHEIGLIQLCDILIGALGYNQQKLSTNQGKLDIINLIKKRSGRSLSSSTLPSELKFNVFFWQGNSHI